MLNYVSEIRVSLELLFTIASLWWAIRIFALSTTQKERMRRDEDMTIEQRASTLSSIKKLKDTSRKFQSRIIPGQMTVLKQIEDQISTLTGDLHSSKLPEKVQMYKEVQEFYTADPEARYFRSSDWSPHEDDS